jgi:uncharacterized protein (TIGR00299 family) protein
MQRFLLFDPEFSGVSGDMMVAALASITDEKKIKDAIEKICKSFPGIETYSIKFSKVQRNGIIANKLDLVLNECEDRPAEDANCQTTEPYRLNNSAISTIEIKQTHEHTNEHPDEQKHTHEHPHEHTNEHPDEQKHTHEHPHEHTNEHPDEQKHTYEHPYEHINEHPDEQKHTHEHPHEHTNEHPDEQKYIHEHLHKQPLNNPNQTQQNNKERKRFPRASLQTLQTILKASLNELKLNEAAETFANKILNILIEAEAEVHGIAKDAVHLHEIGSVDTIIDIIGITVGLNELHLFDQKTSSCKNGCESQGIIVIIKPISVGGGVIKIDHGILPVPAPATSAILRKYQLKFKEGPILKELATPTGVAVLAALKTIYGDGSEYFNQIKAVEKTGISTGNLKIDDRPNIFSIQVGNIESIHSTSGKMDFNKDTQQMNDYLGKYKELVKNIVILETNLDDITGEYSGTLVSELIALGAFDVSLIATVSKKNRAGLILRVVTDHALIESLCDKIFQITGTLGIRIQENSRICLERVFQKFNVEIEGKNFEISIKKAIGPSGSISSIKIEYEDLLRIHKETSLPLRIIEQKILSQIKI